MSYSVILNYGEYHIIQPNTEYQWNNFSTSEPSGVLAPYKYKLAIYPSTYLSIYGWKNTV